MHATGARIQPGRTWTVRPRAMAVITAAAFAVGLIVGRQPILDAAGRGAAEVSGGATAPGLSAERGSLIDFRAGERTLAASAARFAERDALILFRATERASLVGDPQR